MDLAVTLHGCGESSVVVLLTRGWVVTQGCVSVTYQWCFCDASRLCVGVTHEGWVIVCVRGGVADESGG